MASVGETRLLEILLGLGLLTTQQRDTADEVFMERCASPEQADRLIGAYLVNKEVITAEQLELAEICQKGLRDPSLLVQTRTHVQMAKYAAEQIRHKIRENSRLADAILRTGEVVKRKSSSSDYVAVGFVAGRRARDDDKSNR